MDGECDGTEQASLAMLRAQWTSYSTRSNMLAASRRSFSKDPDQHLLSPPNKIASYLVFRLRKEAWHDTFYKDRWLVDLEGNIIAWNPRDDMFGSFFHNGIQHIMQTKRKGVGLLHGHGGWNGRRCCCRRSGVAIGGLGHLDASIWARRKILLLLLRFSCK